MCRVNKFKKELINFNKFRIFQLIIFLSFRLTFEERNELSRKFKYYHESIRPSELYNLVQMTNGTFFGLNTELEILQTRGGVDNTVYNLKFFLKLKIIF